MRPLDERKALPAVHQIEVELEPWLKHEHIIKSLERNCRTVHRSDGLLNASTPAPGQATAPRAHQPSNPTLEIVLQDHGHVASRSARGRASRSARDAGISIA